MKSRASGSFSTVLLEKDKVHEKKILTALSQSVSIFFSVAEAPTAPPPPVHCCSPVKPECQVYQGRYSLRGCVCVCVWGVRVSVCGGSCTRPAQLLPLRQPPWGEQSLLILSKANCIISFWNVRRLGDPCKPLSLSWGPNLFPCPRPPSSSWLEMKHYFPLPTWAMLRKLWKELDRKEINCRKINKPKTTKKGKKKKKEKQNETLKI